MLYWEGNLIGKKYSQNFRTSEIEEYATIFVSSKICSMEMRAVATLIDAAHQDDGRPRSVFAPSPREVDQVSTVLTSILPTLENNLL